LETLVDVPAGAVPRSERPDSFIEIPPGLRWECIKCGSCCGNVFSDTWIDASLAEYIGPTVEGFCKYLERDSSNRCTRYATRPNICRGYPFIIKKNGDHYLLAIHSKCKGVGIGPVLDITERLLVTLKLVEDDLDLDFMIEWMDPKHNKVRLHRIR
jgi:Fe-S-cluster containining protein